METFSIITGAFMFNIDFTGISFAITGTGATVFRNDVIAQIVEANGTSHSTVKRDTTILLTGRGNPATQKHLKADKYGVTKIDVDDFVEWARNPSITSRAAGVATAAINRARSAPPAIKKRQTKDASARIRKMFEQLSALQDGRIEMIDF